MALGEPNTEVLQVDLSPLVIILGTLGNKQLLGKLNGLSFLLSFYCLWSLSLEVLKEEKVLLWGLWARGSGNVAGIKGSVFPAHLVALPGEKALKSSDIESAPVHWPHPQIYPQIHPDAQQALSSVQGEQISQEVLPSLLPALNQLKSHFWPNLCEASLGMLAPRMMRVKF